MITWLGIVPSGGEWYTSGCSGAEPRARWMPDGSIETTAVLEKREFPSAVLQWSSEISTSAAKHGVPASLIAAFMAAESGGNPKAASFCCYGLMGFLPATASSVAGRPVGAAELVNDPALNVDLGAKLLKILWDKYNGNVIKMAASYNAGSVKCGAPGKCAGYPNQWKVITDCANGKAVDYPGRIIAFNNSALGKVGGTVSVKKSSVWLLPVLIGGAGAVWYFGRRRKS